MAVNLPFESVIPEVGFKEPPLLVKVTVASATGTPLEVTVTVIVEVSEVVILLGLAETSTESVSGGMGSKFAISVIGPFIVIVADGEEPVYEPLPDPVHPVNLKPLAGEAEIVNLVPASYQPLLGETVPPFEGLACILR